MADFYYAEGKPGLAPLNYSAEMKFEPGKQVRLYSDLTITVTAPQGSLIPVAKAVGTDTPIVTRVPFHLGFVNGTTGLVNVVIRSGVIVSDETDVIVLDRPTSDSTVEHYVLIGYKALEDVAESLLDTLGLDTKMTSIKKYLTTLKNVEAWIVDYEENHDKPFAGMLCSDDTTHHGTGVPSGIVPISYTFFNGRKVYKACVIGVIEPLNDSWRTLCDTITFMEKDDVLLLYISSEGGDTQTASSFISAVALCKGTVVTIACGSCASAGPVIWSVGHVRLVTDNAAMMVHSMAISDPAVKTTSHIVDLGEFVSMVTEKFLSETVGKVGLATDEEIRTIVDTSKEYYHSAKEVVYRTGSPVIESDRDIWDIVFSDKKKETN